MLKILFSVLSANVVVLALKLISGFLFPAFMTTESYGDYQTFSLYLSYLPILTLGFPTGMFVQYGGVPFDQIHKSRYKSEVHLLIGILLFFTSVFFLIWLLIPDKMLLYVTACIVPYCLVCSYQSLYQAWGEFKKYTVIHLLTATAPLLGAAGLLALLEKLNAEYYIYLFIAVYALCAIIILSCFRRETADRIRAAYFDKTNFQTLKTGFLICLGNYINILFHSADKQFVKSFFDTTAFSSYSFSLSMQSVVMMLISSAAQPMYHFFASGQVKQEQIKTVMRILLMLGSVAGIAYQGCRMVVTRVLPNYTGSLPVIAVYFAALPPMAVVNCLCLNLYKLSRQTKQYVHRLAAVLVLSVVLNGLSVLFLRKTLWIAIATVIVYYLWLLADARQFKPLQFGVRDCIFLLTFLATYLISLQIENPVSAISVYVLPIVLLCAVVYNDEVRFTLRTVRKNLTQNDP